MSSTNQPTKTDDDDVEGGGGAAAAAATIKILSIYLSHNTDTIRSFSFRQHSNSLFFFFHLLSMFKNKYNKDIHLIPSSIFGIMIVLFDLVYISSHTLCNQQTRTTRTAFCPTKKKKRFFVFPFFFLFFSHCLYIFFGLIIK